MSDYYRVIDLNPPAALGGPIVNPLDPRAMHYFGFTSEGQEILLLQPFAGQPTIDVSWHCANQPTTVPAMPPPPIDGVLSSTTFPAVLRYDEHHERAHAIVWLDPLVLPPAGQPVLVSVRAWRTT